VGVHLFAHWLDQDDAFGPVVMQLKQAIEAHKRAHPDNDFALLHHREPTLRRRFQALFFAPLLGIETLTAFDTREHALPTLLGRGYQSATLGQFLGQLERIDAAAALLPALVPPQPGKITYVDGHMIAFWTRMSMHKGKITMLGRIMAGSQAIIAHNEAGQALFVEYHPPDRHVSQVIIAYCQQVVEATGITLFVIDRAVNSVAMACAFDTQGWGLLCMLDDNEYDGLDSFDATPVGPLADGTRVYSGPWKVPRQEDPRHFVIVEPAEGKTLVYWGTPKVRDTLEASEWPQVYRERSERQENSFKRMIDHGALNTNYGRKKIVGPDRHQQRARRLGKINGIFAPVAAGAHPRRPLRPDAAAPLDPATCACRSVRWRGSECVSRGLRGRGHGHGPRWQAGEGGWHPGVPRFSAHVADGTTPRGVDLGECEAFLASTGRSNGRWDRRQLEMPQDTCDHRLLGDDGNDPERTTTAKRTGAHIEPKDAAQQPGPRPVRGSWRRLLPVHTLLASCGNDRGSQRAMRRQTAPVAHEVDPRHGHKRRQLFEQFQRREANACGAIRPWVGEGVEEIAIGVLFQTFK
jgi:hypothetical protein